MSYDWISGTASPRSRSPRSRRRKQKRRAQSASPAPRYSVSGTPRSRRRRRGDSPWFSRTHTPGSRRKRRRKRSNRSRRSHSARSRLQRSRSAMSPRRARSGMAPQPGLRTSRSLTPSQRYRNARQDNDAYHEEQWCECCKLESCRKAVCVWVWIDICTTMWCWVTYVGCFFFVCLDTLCFMRCSKCLSNSADATLACGQTCNEHGCNAGCRSVSDWFWKFLRRERSVTCWCMFFSALFLIWLVIILAIVGTFKYDAITSTPGYNSYHLKAKSGSAATIQVNPLVAEDVLITNHNGGTTQKLGQASTVEVPNRALKTLVETSTAENGHLSGNVPEQAVEQQSSPTVMAAAMALSSTQDE